EKPQGGAEKGDGASGPDATTTDPLRPVNVFSAPTSKTIAAARTVDDESVYTPTVAHAQLYQARLQAESLNKRLPSDAEISAREAADAARVASVRSVDVKVRFPDNTSAEWVFGPADSGATLHRAVRSVMADASAPFRLVLP